MSEDSKKNRIYYCLLGFLGELEARYAEDEERELDADELLTLFNLSNVGFTISEEQFKEAMNRAVENDLVEWVGEEGI